MNIAHGLRPASDSQQIFYKYYDFYSTEDGKHYQTYQPYQYDYHTTTGNRRSDSEVTSPDLGIEWPDFHPNVYQIPYPADMTHHLNQDSGTYQSNYYPTSRYYDNRRSLDENTDYYYQSAYKRADDG